MRRLEPSLPQPTMPLAPPARSVDSSLQREAFGVRVLTNSSEFQGLRAEWNRLLDATQGNHVFLTHEWFAAALGWMEAANQLYVICLYRQGRLAAALPLVRSKGHRSGTRRLEYLTVPDTQSCDLVVPSALRGATAAAFAAELHRRRHEWDVLSLRHVWADSVIGTDLRTALTGLGMRQEFTIKPENPFVSIGGDWAEYYDTRSRRFKKANNLSANRLAKAGHIEVRWLEPGTGDAATLGRFVDEVVKISGASWKRRTSNSLDNPGPQAFIRTLSELTHAAGNLSIWVLLIDGTPIAMEYQIVGATDVFALRSDFVEAWATQSPGSYLNRHLMQAMFGGRYRRYYMGAGNNAYKRHWTDQLEPTGTLTAFSPTLRGAVSAAWELALKPRLRGLRGRAEPRDADGDTGATLPAN